MKQKLIKIKNYKHEKSIITNVCPDVFGLRM